MGIPPRTPFWNQCSAEMGLPINKIFKKILITNSSQQLCWSLGWFEELVWNIYSTFKSFIWDCTCCTLLCKHPSSMCMCMCTIQVMSASHLASKQAIHIQGMFIASEWVGPEGPGLQGQLHPGQIAEEQIAIHAHVHTNRQLRINIQLSILSLDCEATRKLTQAQGEYANSKQKGHNCLAAAAV